MEAQAVSLHPAHIALDIGIQGGLPGSHNGRTCLSTLEFFLSPCHTLQLLRSATASLP